MTRLIPRTVPAQAPLPLAGLLLAVATFWLAPGAIASQGTTPSGQVQSVTVGHTSTTAGHSATIEISTTLAKTDGSHASPLTEIDMQLPSGMSRNPGLYPTCAQAVLEDQGPAGCPQGSRIGHGVLLEDARPVVVDPISVLVTAFNGTDGSVLLFVFPDLGPTFVIAGTPVNGGLDFAIPPIPTLPSAPDATITQLTLDLGVGGYFVNPPTQCAQGWAYGFDFAYQNGERLSLAPTVDCAPITLPPTLTLSSERDTETVGHQHCVTATLESGTGDPIAGTTVRFSVSGTNSASGAVATGTGGDARFCYTGTTPGEDEIDAFADTDGDGMLSTGEPQDTAFNLYTDMSQPATLLLSPGSATTPVGTQHCVTAAVGTGSGDPLGGVLVSFFVDGANTASGSSTSDAAGQAGFCYTGQAVGTDDIFAFADTNDNGFPDGAEPGDFASNTYVAASGGQPGPSPAQPQPASKQGPAPQVGCVVPKVKGLSVAKAKKKLGAAGCHYRVRGAGRVTSTSPGAGTRTTQTVVVKAKKKAHKRKVKKHKRKRH
jgi:hypothetical protein